MKGNKIHYRLRAKRAELLAIKTLVDHVELQRNFDLIADEIDQLKLRSENVDNTPH